MSANTISKLAYALALATTIASCGARPSQSDSHTKSTTIAAASISVQEDIRKWNQSISMQVDSKGIHTKEVSFVECAAVREVAQTFLCAHYDGTLMNKALARADIFIEGYSAVKTGTLVSRDSKTYSDAVRELAGYDLKSHDLLAYWDAVQKACKSDATLCVDSYETEFFQGFVLKAAESGKDFILITYAIEGIMPWSDVVPHEILHAQYFMQPEFQKIVDEFWAHDVSGEDRETIKLILSNSYDSSNDLLMRNEFQAYLLAPGYEQTTIWNVAQKYHDALKAKLVAAGVGPLAVQ